MTGCVLCRGAVRCVWVVSRDLLNRDDDREMMMAKVWDSEWARLDRELSRAREAHERRPWHEAEWKEHVDAFDAFEAYRDAACAHDCPVS